MIYYDVFRGSVGGKGGGEGGNERGAFSERRKMVTETRAIDIVVPSAFLTKRISFKSTFPRSRCPRNQTGKILRNYT